MVWPPTAAVGKQSVGIEHQTGVIFESYLEPLHFELEVVPHAVVHDVAGVVSAVD